MQYLRFQRFGALTLVLTAGLELLAATEFLAQETSRVAGYVFVVGAAAALSVAGRLWRGLPARA